MAAMRTFNEVVIQASAWAGYCSREQMDGTFAEANDLRRIVEERLREGFETTTDHLITIKKGRGPISSQDMTYNSKRTAYLLWAQEIVIWCIQHWSFNK